MLPHIDPHQRHRISDGVLILRTNDAQLPARLSTNQPPPTAPLHSKEVLLKGVGEGLDASPVLLNGGRQGGRGGVDVRLGAVEGSQVLPEQRVVDVAAGVELDLLLLLDELGDVGLGLVEGFALRGECRVELVDVGFVVLVVVDVHDFFGDGGFEGLIG